MKDKKRAKLPRGLRWHSECRFIWFTWYDSQGRQHKKSTETSDMHLLKGVMSYADCWSDTLAVRYRPLREMKSRAGKTASTDQMINIINTAKENEYWQVAMWCGAVGGGPGCRSGEIWKLQLKDICLLEGKLRVVREIAKSRKQGSLG